MVFAVFALVLGLIAPVHAGPPQTTPPSVVQPTAPDVQPAVVIYVYLTANRALGPPSGVLFFVVLRGLPHSAAVNLYAYAGGDPVNREDPSGLDWRWNGSDWDYEPGTNPFVPYPTFKPTGSEYQEYTYIDAEKYVQLRQRQPSLDALHGEGTGVINNYGYGPLFESPYQHWDKIPTADILNSYRTSMPAGAEIITVPTTGQNFLNTAGSSAEEAGVILYGRRLSRANGTLDVGASAAAGGQIALSGFENGVIKSYLEFVADENRRSKEWAIAKVKGDVEIFQGVLGLAIPGSGVASLGRGLIGPAMHGVGDGLRGIAPYLSLRNYRFDRATVGMTGFLPQFRLEEPFLYRGVPAGTERYRQAMAGLVRPRGSLVSSSALEKHVLGEDVASGVTSWTTDINQARRFAGVNGVILRIEADRVRSLIMTRPNVGGKYANELESLLRGDIHGFEVLP